MRRLRSLRSLWRNLAERDRVERDLDDELQATLDLLVAEKIDAGCTPDQARRSALIELRIEPLKEQVRDVRMGIAMETLAQDLRYAWRHIRRSPGFAVAAVLTLALGLGASTAMFSMLNALTWRRLAIGDPDGLVAIAPLDSRGLDRSTPVDAIAHLQDGPLAPLCGYLGGIVLPVLAGGSPVQTSTTFVTSECLDAFQVQPVLGRGITEADAPIYSRGTRVAMISHRLWQRTFNGDPDVLGRAISVNDVELAIIGVLPPGFIGLEIDHGVDIYTPFDTVLLATPARRQLAGFLLGRLKPGVAFEAAEAELEARWPAILDAVLPASLPPSELANFRDSRVRLERIGTGRSTIRTRYGRPLTMILGLTGLLLLLACVNLGGLLLARLTGRSGELSTRLALGGTRWRIAQQMLMESALLALAGAALAIPLSYAIVSALVSLLPPANLPHTIVLTPDTRVLIVTGAVALLVTAALSALPLRVAMRHHGGSHATWDRTIVGVNARWSRALLVAQVAVSIVLLSGATLLTRSLYLLQHHDLGIDTDDIVTIRTLPLPGAANTGRNSLSDFNRYLDRIMTLPGVRAVAFARGFPRNGTFAERPVGFVGEPSSGVTTSSDYVSPGFFRMMRIPVVAGRSFTAADEASAEPVAVVSESLARALAPLDGNVLGRRIRFGPIAADQNRLIIGVVGNATAGDPRQAEPRLVYRPLQLTATSSLSGHLLIETGDPAAAATGTRDIMRGMGRDYPLEIISLRALLDRAPASERMSAATAAAVGVLALILALIGVHGVLAYSVSRRRREIGLRVAVGATPGVVARSIVREGLALIALGVMIGLPLAVFGARSLKALMFGISELDVATFAAVAVCFLVLGAAAGVVPARRAASIDPVRALRAD